MADAPKKTTESAIPAPEPAMTQWQARRKMGWMSTIDFLFIFTFLGTLLATLLWAIFGYPTVVHLILIALGIVIMLQAWGLLLHYRAMIFTLDVRADINMMPVEAARMAVGHITGLNSKQDEHPDVKT